MKNYFSILVAIVHGADSAKETQYFNDKSGKKVAHMNFYSINNY